MSASVATPMAGLLNYDFGSDNMPEFTATDFPDHMELDRSPELDKNYDHNSDASPSTQRRDSAQGQNNATTSEEQKEALGNLLGALMPNQSEQSGDASNLNNMDTGAGSLMAQEQFATDGQAPPPVTDPTRYGVTRLPSFDATAAAELFANEDFSHIEPDMNMPLTPNGQGSHTFDMPHLRQDSFASQGSVAQRPATPQQREFEAFARLQFEDGSYYLNTYACELGRDVLAYRAALQKEREEQEAEMNGHGRSHSSSGRASHPSGRMRRQIGSQVQGSVVSEQGGFAGIDETPMRPPKNPEKPTMSSQESESSVVKPAEYLINPRTMPSFDYHRSTELQAKWTAQEENEGEAPDNEQPAAVTAAHLPNPNMCPLIPIHGKPKDGQTDAELHKKISRRHVKIQWSFDRDCWEMRVQGRNGAFCDDKFVRWKGVVPLEDGAVIQIAHVVLTFRLPKTPQQQAAQESLTDVDADEALPSVEPRLSESIADDERRESITEEKATPKISLKFTQKTEPTPPELPLGPDGLPIPKRRGPGRPPKDGIMSTRERREREKAAKAKLAKEANGGRTPPPSMQRKFSKPEIPAVEEIKVEVKPEKRKYTKRKATDENGNAVPDVEGEAEDIEGGNDGEPKTKKARAQREKSESPEYPPRESLTAEQLARPPESYAQLLYKILLELYPRALPLKDIYRELKKRYPWFVHEATTEGWQSSVRHNLNSEFGKLFDKGDKEGKGFAWRAIPNVQLPQTEKKRTTQTTAQRPRPPPQRPQFQAIPGQSIQWQGTGPLPANGAPPPFINQGPWPQGQGQGQGQANNNWQQNGTPPAGVQQQPNSASTPGSALHRPSQAPQQGPPTGRLPTPAGAGVNGNGPAPPNPTQPPQVPPVSSSLPSNMPCTLGGIEAIKRFEVEMLRQMGMGSESAPSEKKDFWIGVFQSAKRRVLHGHTTSSMPGPESREEKTVIDHMRNFVKHFANPNFKGFIARTVQPSANGEGSAEVRATPPTQASPSGATPAVSATAANPTAKFSNAEDQTPIAAATTSIADNVTNVSATATAVNGATSSDTISQAAAGQSQAPPTEQTPVEGASTQTEDMNAPVEAGAQ